MCLGETVTCVLEHIMKSVKWRILCKIAKRQTGPNRQSRKLQAMLECLGDRSVRCVIFIFFYKLLAEGNWMMTESDWNQLETCHTRSKTIYLSSMLFWNKMPKHDIHGAGTWEDIISVLGEAAKTQRLSITWCFWEDRKQPSSAVQQNFHLPDLV